MILLDTHALVWWVNGSRELSASAADAIDRERMDGSTDAGLLVSAITCWEIGMLVRRGRLELAIDLAHWIETLRGIPNLRLISLAPRTAVAATQLPGTFHADPADRFLVAQARELGSTMITADQRILSYPHVRTLW